MAVAAWKGYLRFLEKFPLLTMASTTGTLMVAGDGISQLVVERQKISNYDYARSGRFFVLGFIGIGPMMRGWYLILDRTFSHTKGAALKMVIADQTCGAPVILGTFLTGMCLLRQESPDVIKAKIQRDFWPVLKTNWMIWPIAQCINFYFLPLQHRVLFVNFVALFWNTYLAFISEQK